MSSRLATNNTTPAFQKQPAKALTASELKTLLYRRFQEDGVLDDLRTQLRHRLISQILKGKQAEKEDGNVPGTTPGGTTLALQISNWLLCEHLRRCGYDYTLSTLMSESRLMVSPLKALTVQDVLYLVGISHDSLAYRQLTNLKPAESRGLLYDLVRILLDSRKKTDARVQTEVSGVPSSSFKNGTLAGDDSSAEKHRRPSEETNGRFLHQLLEEKYRLELDTRLMQFKENELDHVRRAQESRFDEELAAARAQLESEHQKRMERLESKEAELQEEVERMRSFRQEENHELRQQLLKQLEGILQKEERMTVELSERRNRIQEEEARLNRLKGALENDKEDLDKKFAEFNSHLEREMVAHRQQAEKELALKKETLVKWEEILREKEKRLEEGAKNENRIDPLFESQRKIQELELTIQTIQEDYTNLLKENAAFRERLQKMSDYTAIKTELETTKARLAMHQDTSGQQERMASLQEEMKTDHTKHIHDLDKAVWAEQRERMVSEIAELKKTNQSLSEQLKKENEENQAKSRVIHERYQKSLQRESLRPIQSAVTVSERDRPRVSWQVAKPSKSASHLQHSSIADVAEPFHTAYTIFKREPFRFIDEAKQRVSKLQAEEEILERKYLDFLQNRIQSTSHVGRGWHGNMLEALGKENRHAALNRKRMQDTSVTKSRYNVQPTRHLELWNKDQRPSEYSMTSLVPEGPQKGINWPELDSTASYSKFQMPLAVVPSVEPEVVLQKQNGSVQPKQKTHFDPAQYLPSDKHPGSVHDPVLEADTQAKLQHNGHTQNRDPKPAHKEATSIETNLEPRLHPTSVNVESPVAETLPAGLHLQDAAPAADKPTIAVPVPAINLDETWKKNNSSQAPFQEQTINLDEMWKKNISPPSYSRRFGSATENGHGEPNSAATVSRRGLLAQFELPSILQKAITSSSVPESTPTHTSKVVTKHMVADMTEQDLATTSNTRIENGHTTDKTHEKTAVLINDGLSGTAETDSSEVHVSVGGAESGDQSNEDDAAW